MGKRDLYKVFGYQRIIRKDDYNGKYRRSIAFRIVNAYPDASWREFPKITDDGDSEEETTFEKQVSDAVEILKLDSVFKKADKAANLGRFSVLFIGIRDGESDLRQPVREGIYDISDIMHLTPYPESCITISSFNQDPTSPRFGLPELYQLTTRNDENSTRTNVGLGIEVHWTRVIHIAENSIENEVYGIPRLEPVYNYLDNIDKVIGGSSETFWLNSRGGLHVNSEADVSFDTDSSSSDNLQKNLDEYTHNLTRYIKTRGLDVNPIEFNIADPKSNFETNISLISGTTGIPQRILTGSERGELASSSDDKNWNNRVVERR
ncbi:MAG TPA: anti-CBASS Acb1 family protein, partial [Thermodesulfobacteriota bacterium]|nr:anti-CBASS Acb1 family protein [Thermodesulfobacteriota bacterium]